jgi:ankyrin repeat protein
MQDENSLAVLVSLLSFVVQSTGQTSDIVSAAKRGDVETVQKLLKGGISPNQPDAQGRTALHEAAANGNVQLFKILIAAGADIHAQDKQGVTPEFIALHVADFRTGFALMKAFPITSSPTGAGSDAAWTLTAAIDRRQQSVVEMLVKLGVNVNAVDNNGDYPLDLAAQKGDAAIAELLLSHGANINIRNKSGGFPIHSAALAGNTIVVRLLLDRGSDVNCRVEPTGETPLYLAASFGRTDTVKLLLSRGASREIANVHGVTPLAAAIKAEQAEVVGLFRSK